MSTLAVLMRAPQQLELKRLALTPPGSGDVVVDIAYSGISTGTERLLWTGKMPSFPGMGYPLVPGYESVGTVVDAGAASTMRAGDKVFVPGARCFGDVRGLFGGAASRVVIPGEKAIRIDSTLSESGVLLALAATAQHALGDGNAPELIVGHGVLGRLIARLVIANGSDAPVVWETNADRRSGAEGYDVVDPETDVRRDYKTICDVSGDASILDTLIGRLARGGEIILAGFYSDRVAFDFPPAFMREARIRAAAEWKPQDLEHVLNAISDGRLSLDGLITHRSAAAEADNAYRVAFGDPACLKMVLDWRNIQ
ncbi:MAG: chlorophyll synthesis pathway protein BchC [Pseudomonadota bacterium]